MRLINSELLRHLTLKEVRTLKLPTSSRAIQQDTRAGLSRTLGWPEVRISFSVTLSHSVPGHYTSCREDSPTSQSVYQQPKLYQITAW